MYNESTTIVDVVTLGEGGYALSMKAEDLWVAFEVVRRHIDADGARHYSQMVEAKTTSDGYSFKFDTGDVFTCASHEEYPTSETLSDESSGGGSGGGVLVVNDVNGTLDKTWTEIKNALLSGGASISHSDGGVASVTGAFYDDVYKKYYCVISMVGNYTPSYSADSASDYPTAAME